MPTDAHPRLLNSDESRGGVSLAWDLAGRVAAVLLGLAFLLAALAKGADMATQVAYLERVDLLPRALLVPFLILLPTVETADGVAILIPATRHMGVVAALLLLLGFTVFLIYEVARGSDVACGCFGEFVLLTEAAAQNRVSLVRNVVMIGLGMLALSKYWRKTPVEVATPSDVSVGAAGSRENGAGSDSGASIRGFTLAELIVVLGIIALLLALLLPLLASARRSAQSAACAANLREIARFATMWAADHDGFLPLDGEIRYDSPAATWPATLGDPRRRRYDYSTYYAGPTDAGPSTFLVAMVRQYSFDERLLDQGDWEQEVLPAMRVAEILQCPATDRSALWAEKSSSGFHSSVAITRGQKGAFGRETTTDYSTNGGLLGFQSDRPRRHRAYNGQLSRVRGAGQVALAGDGDGDFMSWTPDTDRPGTRVTLADVLMGSDEIVNYGSRRLPQLDPLRHRGRANIAFIDGHVESVILDEPSLERVVLLQD